MHVDYPQAVTQSATTERVIMSAFLLYFLLPVLVAVVGTCGFFAIRDAKETALASSEPLPTHPAVVPIRDAQFYMKNGHWIFGVRSEDRDLAPAWPVRPMTQWDDFVFENSRGDWAYHEVTGQCKGECDLHGV